MKAISEKGFKVSMGGTGADELFTDIMIMEIYFLSQCKKYRNVYKALEG